MVLDEAGRIDWGGHGRTPDGAWGRSVREEMGVRNTETASTLPRTKDGVRMAILSNRMESIARKMQNTLFRTGRSGVLNTAHDFSC